MKVSVLGLGYVGAVSAACLSRDGHDVVGVDVNPVKVDQMNEGRSPVIEAGVEGLIRQGLAAGSLRATRDARSAVLDTEISIVCVGTPSQRNGDLDLRHVENVCRQIGSVFATKEARHVVVIRSTVLPGTVEARLIPILERESGKEAGRDFGVCMHPEFLREGTAVMDYDNPAYLVIGELERASGDRVIQLYGGVDAPIIRTSVRTAEMVKYASNAFHAVKVAFSNEIGSFCKRHGIDGREIMEIVCRDRKLNISSAYLRPGFAFGGSCLPKDLRALVHRSKMTDVDCAVLMATLHSNRAHFERGLALVEDRGSRRVGVLGLSFKPGTDDVRESPAVALVEAFVGRGFAVAVYDETVRPDQLVGSNRASLERELPHVAELMRSSVDDVLAESDVVVVTNTSTAFRDVAKRLNGDQVLIDLAGACDANGLPHDRYVGLSS